MVDCERDLILLIITVHQDKDEEILHGFQKKKQETGTGKKLC